MASSVASLCCNICCGNRPFLSYWRLSISSWRRTLAVSSELKAVPAPYAVAAAAVQRDAIQGASEYFQAPTIPRIPQFYEGNGRSDKLRPAEEAASD